jgi:chaperonin GroEL
VALPNHAEDMGAMLMRNLIWCMSQRVGDGSATAAVIARAIFDQASRYRAAGANVMSLKTGIEAAMMAALDLLAQMAMPVRTHTELIGLANGITGHTGLSNLLGEMFYNLGSEAHIQVEEYVAPYLDRVYLEGGRWIGRIASPYLYTEPSTRRSVLTDCAMVLFEGDVTSAEQILPLLTLLADAPQAARKVALFAHEVSGEALGTLVANHQAKTVEILAVELRRAGVQREADFADLGVLTGATVLSFDRGQWLQDVRMSDFGLARRVEATPDQCLVSGETGASGGVQTVIDAHLHTLQTRIKLLPRHEADHAALVADLQQRIARLVGRVATLKVGAYSEIERQLLIDKANKALRALPLAINEGVVAGGGCAYLKMAQTLRMQSQEARSKNQEPSSVDSALSTQHLALNTDEWYWGWDILAAALEAPFRQICKNAGIDEPDIFVAATGKTRRKVAFDALTQQLLPARKSGHLDAVGVLRKALQIAVSGALMALTVDVMVLHREPKVMMEP